MPCLPATRHLVLAGLALQRAALGARSGTHEEVDQEAGECCCRGPLALQCRQLEGNQLQEGKCPEKLGYRWRDASCRMGRCPEKLSCMCRPLWSFQQFGFVPANPPCSGSPPPVAAVEVNVTAYWMRHGWSCANAMKAQYSSKRVGWKAVQKNLASLNLGGLARKSVSPLGYRLYPDPPLTDLAKERAEKLGSLVRERLKSDIGETVPLVFSSAMVRAMQTATLNFPDSDVYPLPYIAEMGSSPDNTPTEWSSDKERAVGGHIKFDPAVNPATHPDRLSGLKSDYTAFKRYFPVVLKKLLGDKVKAGEDIPVVIVSHSDYMKHTLGQCNGGHDKKTKKPLNNEVWVQKYRVKLGAYDAELLEQSCSVLFPLQEGANVFPDTPKVLCPQDVKSCEKGKPDLWVEEYMNDNVCKKSALERDTAGHETYTDAVPLI